MWRILLVVCMVDRVRLKRYRCSVTKIEQIFLLRVSITLDSMHTNTHTHSLFGRILFRLYHYFCVTVLLIPISFVSSGFSAPRQNERTICQVWYLSSTLYKRSQPRHIICHDKWDTSAINLQSRITTFALNITIQRGRRKLFPLRMNVRNRLIVDGGSCNLFLIRIIELSYQLKTFPNQTNDFYSCAYYQQCSAISEIFRYYPHSSQLFSTSRWILETQSIRITVGLLFRHAHIPQHWPNGLTKWTRVIREPNTKMHTMRKWFIIVRR